MAKRFIESGFFESPFVRKLDNEGKLFYLYVITKVNNAGIWSVDFELASFLTGCKFDDERITEQFVGSGKAVQLSEDRWWLVGFLEHQNLVPISPSNNATKNIPKMLIDAGLDPSKVQEYCSHDLDEYPCSITLGANKGLARGLQGSSEGVSSPPWGAQDKDKDKVKDKVKDKDNPSRAHARENTQAQTTSQHGADDALPTSRHQTLSGGDKVEAYLLEKQSTKEIIGMKKRWKAAELEQKYAQAVELFAMHLAANDDWKSAGETVKHFNNWMGRGYDKAIEELGQQTSKDPRDQRAPDGMPTLEAVLARIEDGDVSLHGLEQFFERRKEECEAQGLDFKEQRGCTWEEYESARDRLRKELANAN